MQNMKFVPGILFIILVSVLILNADKFAAVIGAASSATNSFAKTAQGR